jgi:predicted outer membrane repeat protein
MSGGANLGGAIYAKNSILQVTNSSFLWNRAAGDGGAIYTEKTPANEGGGLITLTDNQFNENSAEQNGGSLAFVNEEEGVFITTTWFRQGEAGNYGGAIYAEGSEVTGSLLEYRLNTAAYGGAVYSKRLGEGLVSQYSDDRAEYHNNVASEIGGAIFSENSDLTLESSTLYYNEAKSCGAIRNGGDPALDVRAGDLETAPQVNSSSFIDDTQIIFNDATVQDGGGACHVMGKLTVRNSIFTYNNAPESGGGLLIHDEAEIQGGSFNNNTAANGGGIYIGHPQGMTAGGIMNHANADYLDFFTLISGALFSANTSNSNDSIALAPPASVTIKVTTNLPT